MWSTSTSGTRPCPVRDLRLSRGSHRAAPSHRSQRSPEQSWDAVRGEPGGSDSGVLESSESRRQTRGPSPCTRTTGASGVPGGGPPFLERSEHGTGRQLELCPARPGPPHCTHVSLLPSNPKAQNKAAALLVAWFAGGPVYTVKRRGAGLRSKCSTRSSYSYKVQQTNPPKQEYRVCRAQTTVPRHGLPASAQGPLGLVGPARARAGRVQPARTRHPALLSRGCTDQPRPKPRPGPGSICRARSMPKTRARPIGLCPATRRARPPGRCTHTGRPWKR